MAASVASGDDAGREVSLACLSLLRGRGGSTTFPFPLPSTGGGSLRAWAVGSLMVSDLDFGAAGSGTKASSSAGGFFFLNPPSRTSWHVFSFVLLLLRNEALYLQSQYISSLETN